MRRHPNVRRDNYSHLIIDGYTFMGRPRVPPMPNRIAMRDRATGAIKVLSHTVDSNGLPVALDLIDRADRWPDVYVFDQYEGPYYGNWRLYLSNGTLLAEPVVMGHGEITYSSGLILTRRNFDRIVLQISVDTSGNVVTAQYEL